MRLLQLVLPVPRNYLSSYADDFAFACYNIFEALLELQAVMGVISATTGLELNFPKVVVIPIGTLEVEVLANFLGAMSSGFSSAKVALAAKYLGLQFGPAAHENAWVPQAITLQRRSKQLQLLQLALTTGIKMYNIYISSTLGHVSCFHKPDWPIREAQLH